MQLPVPRTVTLDARMVRHSGVGTYLRNPMRLLSRSNELRITALGCRETLARYDFFDAIGLIPDESPIYGVREQWALARKVPACDLFWSPHFNVPLLPVRARRRLVTVHDVYPLAHPRAFGRLARSYAGLLLRQAIAASDRVITVSEFSRAEIERLAGGRGRLTVIHNGVEADFASGFERRVIPEDYVLFVGNLKPNKNLGALLTALALLAAEFPHLKLFVAGRTSGLRTADTAVLDRVRAAPAGRVRLLGEVPLAELKNLYANARLFVLPSLYEGFGLPLLEAMCFDVPIVASAIAPLREVGGDAIAYFDPRDPQDMARAMRSALREPRHVARPGYREQLRRFSWSASARKHLELIMALTTAERQNRLSRT